MYRLTAEMPYDELLQWLAYFEQRPIGWREDDRTMKLLQVQGVKEKPQAIFATLEPIYNPPQAKALEGTVSVASLKKSAFFQQMVSAHGGVKLAL